MRTFRLAIAGALTLAAPLGAQTLTGAGATFPNPIYTKWFDAYSKQTGVQINYQSIGSGGGIRQFTEGTVDFGATDGPMNDSQIQAVSGNVLHVPTVLGAVVVTYNAPSLGGAKLKFDGDLLVDIFMGRVTKWNDKRIAALNPGVKLPDLDVIVVHRSDGSGTTYVFNDLPFADIKNSSGAFVTPSLESVTAAAAGTKLKSDTDFRVSITNAPGADAYPIASFTWLLVHKDGKDVAKAKQIKDFLTWMISPDAQAMARELHYAPLPKEVVALVQARLPTLKAGGKAIASN